VRAAIVAVQMHSIEAGCSRRHEVEVVPIPDVQHAIARYLEPLASVSICPWVRLGEPDRIAAQHRADPAREAYSDQLTALLKSAPLVRTATLRPAAATTSRAPITSSNRLHAAS